MPLKPPLSAEGGVYPLQDPLEGDMTRTLGAWDGGGGAEQVSPRGSHTPGSARLQLASFLAKCMIVPFISLIVMTVTSKSEEKLF